MLTVILFSIIPYVYGGRCCSGENTIVNETCIDGSPIKAPQCQYRFLLTQKHYVRLENGSLMILGDYEEVISPDRFCEAKYGSDGQNASVVCLVDIEENERNPASRIICALLSVVFLIVTIIVYILVPKLRDLQGKCILNSMVGLALAFMTLSIVQLSHDFQHGPCVFWAFATYFTFLLAFFWLNVGAINMWRKTVFPHLFGKSDDFWYILYLIYGYGGAITYLLVTIITHHVEGDHLKPGFGEGVCFFNRALPVWVYFYGPIATLLTINFILFIWTSVKLWMDSAQQSSRIKNLKFKCLLTLKLYLIMGIPWIFEVLSYSFDDVHPFLNIIWAIIDYLNALQGVLIFLVLVLFRKKALRGLANNRLIGSKFPRSWQRLDDGECSDEETLSESK